MASTVSFSLTTGSLVPLSSEHFQGTWKKLKCNPWKQNCRFLFILLSAKISPYFMKLNGTVSLLNIGMVLEIFRFTYNMLLYNIYVIFITDGCLMK